MPFPVLGAVELAGVVGIEPRFFAGAAHLVVDNAEGLVLIGVLVGVFANLAIGCRGRTFATGGLRWRPRRIRPDGLAQTGWRTPRIVAAVFTADAEQFQELFNHDYASLYLIASRVSF